MTGEYGFLCKCGTVIRVQVFYSQPDCKLAYQALDGAYFQRTRSRSHKHTLELPKSGWYRAKPDAPEGRRKVDTWGWRKRSYYHSALFFLDQAVGYSPSRVYCGNPECRGSQFRTPRYYLFDKFKKREVEE